MEIKDKIKNLISEHNICLFMKGTPDSPQCGFSMVVSNILKHLNVKFKGVARTASKVEMAVRLIERAVLPPAN